MAQTIDTISINTVMNLILEDIRANFNSKDYGVTEKIMIENFFGYRVEDYRKLFTKKNTICAVYDGESIEAPSTTHEEEDELNIIFLIVEQILGLGRLKKFRGDFLVDKFRSFITRRRFQNVIDEYSAGFDIQPLFVSDVDLYATLEGGIAVFTIRGSMRFWLAAR